MSADRINNRNNACCNCSSGILTGWHFCDFCGAVINQNENEVECEEHSNQIAIGICVVCNKPICSVCSVKNEKSMLCNDHSHRNILYEWKPIFRPDSEFEADAIIANLKVAEIDTKMFSLQDYISTNKLSQQRILVFVKNSEYEKAKTQLIKLNFM